MRFIHSSKSAQVNISLAHTPRTLKKKLVVVSVSGPGSMRYTCGVVEENLPMRQQRIFFLVENGFVQIAMCAGT